ncbi:hypothetical protein LLE87_35375, partial [Paenibacillus polymyxa]|nr:hypothetical protein [Paenibacillus polymyxa]
AAVGYAGIDDLVVSNIRRWLDDVLVAKHGGRNPAYQDADGQRVMKQAEISVRIALGRGQVWITLAIGAVGVGGLFSIYTYLADT